MIMQRPSGPQSLSAPVLVSNGPATDNVATLPRARTAALKQSLIQKLQQLVARSEELGALLSDPEVITDQNRFRDLSKEFAQLEPVISLFARYEKAREDLAAAEDMLTDDDSAVRDMGREEIEVQKRRLEALESGLRRELIPKDPHDDSNIYLEIRAGTGGDEAAIFAGDLFRMYTKYADTMGWGLEILSAHEGEHGGYKEIISRIVGRRRLFGS